MEKAIVKGESLKSRKRNKSKKKRKPKGSLSATSDRKQSHEQEDSSYANRTELDTSMSVSSDSYEASHQNVSTTRPKSQLKSAPEDTLRWHNQLDDSDEETKRIEIYKQKRRERYRKAAATQIQNSSNHTGFIARINVPSRPPTLKLSNIYAVTSNSSSILYKPTTSISKMSTISC